MKKWCEMKNEHGFTIIEASWSMLVILSLIISITYIVLNNKKYIIEYPLQQYMVLNYVEISEVFYNSKNNFEDDMKQMFDYRDNKVFLSFDNKTYELQLDYKESKENGIHKYTLNIIFPEKFKEISARYFSDVKLERWYYE